MKIDIGAFKPLYHLTFGLLTFAVVLTASRAGLPTTECSKPACLTACNEGGGGNFQADCQDCCDQMQDPNGQQACYLQCSKD